MPLRIHSGSPSSFSSQDLTARRYAPQYLQLELNIMPFLSIIVAAYNSGATLPATLESLSLSLGKIADAEVIILNDSSTDNTQEVIDEWCSQLPNVFTTKVNYRNIGRVRQHAVSVASGDYITMLDSDDLLKPRSLQDAICFLREKQPDMLLTHLLEIRDLSKTATDWHGFKTKKLKKSEAIRRFLVHKDFQAHFIGQFIKRDLLVKFPFPPFSCYEDAWLFPTILNHSNDIIYSSSAPYLHIKNDHSLSSYLNEEKIINLIEATEEMERVFGENYKNLISCHWVNILLRHGHEMSHENIEKTTHKINKIKPLSFMLSPRVRLSFKRKYLEILIKHFYQKND